MKYDIKSAEPTYTGGGIYAMQGELADGNYFMADITFYWAVIVDTEPEWDDSWYVEWQDAHKVEDLCEEDTLDFIESAIRWVKANKPDGNYLMSDMDDILEDIEDTRNGIYED